MTDALALLLGVDVDSPETTHAIEQLEMDEAFLRDLIAIRKAGRPNEAEFADALGVDVEELRFFEADPVDADLAFLRVYSLELGALLVHRVHPPQQARDYFRDKRSLSVPARGRVTWRDTQGLRGGMEIAGHAGLI